ncbi:hypothetical protein M2272_005754 [Mycobacterium frederiksbergense]|uniref:Uncharacterized protein n=1 Tax=Mycolicibacterium frederiksbergense TaxID=117567 RepID=A0ABT6L803_9MYCO|nr:hypothetical protein [Mycolicibacterium frederiksbergense]
MSAAEFDDGLFDRIASVIDASDEIETLVSSVPTVFPQFGEPLFVCPPVSRVGLSGHDGAADKIDVWEVVT